MSEIAVGLLSIWFICLGLAVMVRQHQRFLRWSWRQVQRPFRWAFHRWRTQILAFFAGVGAGKMVQWNAVFWPIAIAVGIILAAWVIGIAIAHLLAQGGAQRYIAMSRDVIHDAVAYLWTNFRTPIIWFSIGMIGSTLIRA